MSLNEVLLLHGLGASIQTTKAGRAFRKRLAEEQRAQVVAYQGSPYYAQQAAAQIQLEQERYQAYRAHLAREDIEILRSVPMKTTLPVKQYAPLDTTRRPGETTSQWYSRLEAEAGQRQRERATAPPRLTQQEQKAQKDFYDRVQEARLRNDPITLQVKHQEAKKRFERDARYHYTEQIKPVSQMAATLIGYGVYRDYSSIPLFDAYADKRVTFRSLIPGINAAYSRLMTRLEAEQAERVRLRHEQEELLYQAEHPEMYAAEQRRGLPSSLLPPISKIPSYRQPPPILPSIHIRQPPPVLPSTPPRTLPQISTRPAQAKKTYYEQAKINIMRRHGRLPSGAFNSLVRAEEKRLKAAAAHAKMERDRSLPQPPPPIPKGIAPYRALPQVSIFTAPRFMALPPI